MDWLLTITNNLIWLRGTNRKGAKDLILCAFFMFVESKLQYLA